MERTDEYILVVGLNNYRTFKAPGPNWKLYLYNGFENTPLDYMYYDPNVYPKFYKDPVGYGRKMYNRARGRLRAGDIPVWRDSLSILIEKEQIDIWFCPLVYALPVKINIPIVNTIPDLQHEIYPEFFTKEELRYRTIGYQYSCKASTATLTISSATEQDIITRYGIDAGKVFVTPLSIDDSFYITKNTVRGYERKVRIKFRLDTDFIYYPANGWPHKNHEKLIKALHLVRKRGLDIMLVLTGAVSDLMKRMKGILVNYNLSSFVRHLGYVNRQEVIGLYSAAKALVFPSLFEGFGIPVLEAMAMGTPVACSNVTSLPEIGGDVPLYFNPQDPESIAEGIVRVVQDEALRRKMISAGKQKAKQFSYRKTALQTHDIFQKIVGGALNPPCLDRPRGLGAVNDLFDGHSFWYFHCNNLNRISIRVSSGRYFSGVAGTTVSVSINHEIIQQFNLEQHGEFDIDVVAGNLSRDGFYRLDICAFHNKDAKQTAVICVLRIKIQDKKGKSLFLL
jgi:glycosyltransferase involved in cell wall biosynthesis